MALVGEAMWTVQLADGEREMTLDQIDQAFNESAIDTTTLVRRPHEDHWITLGDAAGLEEGSTKVLELVESETVIISEAEADDVDALSETELEIFKRPPLVNPRTRTALGIAAFVALLGGGVIATLHFMPKWTAPPKLEAAAVAAVVVPSAAAASNSAKPAFIKHASPIAKGKVTKPAKKQPVPVKKLPVKAKAKTQTPKPIARPMAPTYGRLPGT